MAGGFFGGAGDFPDANRSVHDAALSGETLTETATHTPVSLSMTDPVSDTRECNHNSDILRSFGLLSPQVRLHTRRSASRHPARGGEQLSNEPCGRFALDTSTKNEAHDDHGPIPGSRSNANAHFETFGSWVTAAPRILAVNNAAEVVLDTSSRYQSARPMARASTSWPFNPENYGDFDFDPLIFKEDYDFSYPGSMDSNTSSGYTP
ncbi:hypothetical protein MMC18_008574 [Xylographa bjoerkii]|nr:hypothetical protein [Xylographa bjoerkii]